MEQRVAVTGLGAISALGSTHKDLWAGLCAGKSGVAPIESVDRTDLLFKHGAEVRDFDPADHIDEKRIALLDRFSQLGLVAAREAFADSGLDPHDLDGSRIGAVTGSCLGGKESEEESYERLYRDGKKRASPLAIARSMANAAVGEISLEFGITGPVLNYSTACSSAAHAIGHALWLVRQGVVDLAIAGGTEAPFTLGILKAWEAMRVVSPDTCRPFAVDRNGTIIGEGAAMLVLEPLDAARRRGASIYAELAGFGMTADAHHPTHPSVDGPARAMTAALVDAELDPAQVGHVNAHGTGTLVNDVNEAQAIRRVFGGSADRVAVSSTKAAHGHALGAAGALEAVATVLAVSNGVIPPTVNFTELDPACELDVVANEPRQAPVHAALSNSFAFGGLNAVLAFRDADATR
jgi:nodulation protein E